jgi:hypothetical protein
MAVQTTTWPLCNYSNRKLMINFSSSKLWSAWLKLLVSFLFFDVDTSNCRAMISMIKDTRFFFKKLNSFNSFFTPCLACLFLPQYRTILIFVCRKKCFTITAYWYACTHNMLYSFCYIREQCDGGLWVSLKVFPLTSPFPSQEQDIFSRSWSLNVVAMMMEVASTAAMLVLLLQSI